MGLLRKRTPPPAQPDEPIWLIRTAHQVVDGAWVYQVIRGHRSMAEEYGILPWDTLPGVQQTASDYMNRGRMMDAMIGITLHGKWNQWDLPCPEPPVPGTVQPLDDTQMAEYRHLLEFALTGEEQGKLSSEERKANLHIQLRDVPMASWQKPDINGLREGDRVRLVEDFNGEEVSYKAGNTGTIFVASTAPAEIRMNREMGLHYVAMDKPELGHGLVMVQRQQFEGIPGHADVMISTDGRLSIANVPSP
jgi:hypothetical protein